MSWLGAALKKVSEPTPQEQSREAKRKKLESDRELRLQQRIKRQQQFQAAEQARVEQNLAFQELNQALQELLNLDPDI